MICPKCKKQTSVVNHNGRGYRCTCCWALVSDAQEFPKSWEQIDATNAARKYALRCNIDLRAVQGSGKDGRIMLRDVSQALEG